MNFHNPTRADFMRISQCLKDPKIKRLISCSQVDHSKPAIVQIVTIRGRFVGWVELFNIENGSGEIGIVLPGAKGLGIIVARQWVKKIFFVPGHHTLIANILDSNQIVIEGAKKHGFKEVGRVDHIVTMVVTKDDFERSCGR